MKSENLVRGARTALFGASHTQHERHHTHKFIHMIILSSIDSLLRPFIIGHPHKAIHHHQRRHKTSHGQNRCGNATTIATVVVTTRRTVVIPPPDFPSFLSSSAVEEDGFCGTAGGTTTPAIGQVLASKSTHVPSPSAT
jgi:hypothetical protein